MLADGQDQPQFQVFVGFPRLGHPHWHVEIHFRFNDIANSVGAAGRSWRSHPRHGGSRIGFLPVHFVVRLSRHQNHRPDDGVARTIDQQAVGRVRPDQCSRPDADSVVVYVAVLHRIAERQSAGAAAVDIGGRALRSAADIQIEIRRCLDVDDIVERHLHLDDLAAAVGIAFSRFGGDLDAFNCRRHAVHEMPRIAGFDKLPAGRVAPLAQDGAALQRIRSNGNAVCIVVSGLHDVLKRQPRRPRAHH